MEEPNFKGLLQIHCQKVRVALPQYSCTQSMKDGRAVFLANVTVLGQSFTSEAEFSNKKQAEKSAAKVALLELGILTTDKLNLNPSGDPAQKVGQTCIERNPVSPTTAAEKPHEDEPAASVCSPEVHEKGSVKDPGLASPEVQTSSPPPIAQTLTLRKNSNSVSFKNILQERAHKMGLALPQYETTKEVKGFVCTVTFDGRSFKSDGFLPGKKLAEQNAASLALEVLVTEEKSLGESPVVGDKTIYDASVSYKNLLQENCQQRGHKQPVYSTTWEGSGFFSIVQIGNKTASSKISYVTKKKAEQIAAREALLSIGVSNPEEVYNSKAAKKSKLKRKFAPTADQQRTSWVHSRGGQGLHSSEWTEVDYFWEQAIGKRQKLDPIESCAISRRNFGARTFSIPLDHRRDLTVGEIWKEKKNIAIVGDAEGSFILYCMRFPGTCNIFNTRTMSLVLLEPGHRIIGLDAHYSEHYGKVALQAERCADVIIPETPDPVLTSCGFVLLFQDPQSSSIQVLLKRYLSSPAFVNVAAALAQYFRRRVSGRPVWLDIESITEHISDWMLEEVQNIATMNKEALENVFSYMWKFNKRWCSVLDHPLPNDLQVLKARAADELARRQANGFHHSEDYYRPWSLPKGNFKHRMLSTGLFIEPPAECAVRELKEETGIKLDADEIKNCPQIDLLQKDNLNPHKGDMAKYFLYVYSPDSIEDEVSVSLDQMNTSLEYETSSDQDAVPQFPLLDASSDQVTVEKGQEENKFKDNTQRHVCSSNVDITQQNTSNQMEGHPASESMSVHLEIDEDKKRRGVKRKRDEDDDDDNAAYQGINSTRLQDTHGETLPGQSSCDKSLDVVSTPGNKKEMITARSPHVQGSVHEECAWFTIEEARVKSPIFEQIYQTEQFTELLNSF